MRFFQDGAGAFKSLPFVTTVDSHTEGEATRLIVDGIGPLPGLSMMDKLAYFKAHHDDIRCLLTREPRGSRKSWPPW